MLTKVVKLSSLIIFFNILMLEVGMAHRQLLYESTQIQDIYRGWILAVTKQLTRPTNFVPQASAFLS